MGTLRQALTSHSSCSGNIGHPLAPLSQQSRSQSHCLPQRPPKQAPSLEAAPTCAALFNSWLDLSPMPHQVGSPAHSFPYPFSSHNNPQGGKKETGCHLPEITAINHLIRCFFLQCRTEKAQTLKSGVSEFESWLYYLKTMWLWASISSSLKWAITVSTT